MLAEIKCPDGRCVSIYRATTPQTIWSILPGLMGVWFPAVGLRKRLQHYRRSVCFRHCEFMDYFRVQGERWSVDTQTFPPNSKTIHSFRILKHKLQDAAASWISRTLSMTVKCQIWSITKEYHMKGSVAVLNVITDGMWSDSHGHRLSDQGRIVTIHKVTVLLYLCRRDVIAFKFNCHFI